MYELAKIYFEKKSENIDCLKVTVQCSQIAPISDSRAHCVVGAASNNGDIS